MTFDLIAFDGDDTLWHNEWLYQETQGQLRQLLSPFADEPTVDRTLYETEVRNLRYYGYGIKSFTLSMIETAIEVSHGRASGAEIAQIIGFARKMLTSEVCLLDGVADAVRQLSTAHVLMLITKGDLLDQRSKLDRSGLGPCFHYVEVVSEKQEDTYQALLGRYNVDPARFLMVGNSLRSDILPVVKVGGHAVYIPYQVTWEHEAVVQDPGSGRYHRLDHIGQLPPLICQLESS